MTAASSQAATQPRPPVFVLLDGSSVASARDVPGPWAVLPAPRTRAVAFGPNPHSSSDVIEATVWQVNLPPDPRLADASLDDGQRSLAASERALDDAAARLDAFVRSRTDGSAALPRGVRSPEAALRATLDESRGGPRSARFGLGDDIAEGWERAVERFGAGAAWVRQILGRNAWVETRVEGRLLGHAAIGWTGDTESVLAADADPATAARHARGVALAMASRAATLRRVALAARGAVTLSLVLTPGGALLALPAAWRFITDVIDEVETSRESDREAEGMEQEEAKHGQ